MANCKRMNMVERMKKSMRVCVGPFYLAETHLLQFKINNVKYVQHFSSFSPKNQKSCQTSLKIGSAICWVEFPVWVDLLSICCCCCCCCLLYTIEGKKTVQIEATDAIMQLFRRFGSCLISKLQLSEPNEPAQISLTQNYQKNKN